MLDEYKIDRGILLVMDRGYHDKKLLTAIRGRGLDYLVVIKRNTKIYDMTDAEESIFRWRDSAVRFRHAKISDGKWAYRFENLSHRNDELMDALKAEELGCHCNLNLDKAGNFVLISSREWIPATCTEFIRRDVKSKITSIVPKISCLPTGRLCAMMPMLWDICS